MILADLFFEFLLIGALSFGGGYGTLAMIENAAVSTRGWLTAAQFYDLTAFAEVTPGPIALNAASFAGYTAAGIPGAVAATVGCVLPAFVTVTLLALLWVKYASHPVFSGILGSIRPAVCALVFAAFWSVFSESVFGAGMVSIASLLLFGGCFLLSRTGKVPPAIVILIAGAAGAVLL
ncbi:MAG: chromate transporter [Clostridia bacterium]|nr:chromate transporter [Clostridia bacterium]